MRVLVAVAAGDGLLRGIVMRHTPGAVIPQCGINGSVLHVLPRDLRDFFRIVPGGRYARRAVHIPDRRAARHRFPGTNPDARVAGLAGSSAEG